MLKGRPSLGGGGSAEGVLREIGYEWFQRLEWGGCACDCWGSWALSLRYHFWSSLKDHFNWRVFLRGKRRVPPLLKKKDLGNCRSVTLDLWDGDVANNPENNLQKRRTRKWLGQHGLMKRKSCLPTSSSFMMRRLSCNLLCCLNIGISHRAFLT